MSAELRAALELVMSSRHAPFIANGEPCKCVVHEDARAALDSTSIDGVSGTGLEELRRLSDAATPGPWRYDGDGYDGDIYGADPERDYVAVDREGLAGCVRGASNGEFIVAMERYVRAALAKDSPSRA